MLHIPPTAALFLRMPPAARRRNRALPRSVFGLHRNIRKFPALFRLGSALECCDLTQYGIEHELLAQCFMPNIGGIIAVSYVESQFEFNLISPSVLDYSVIDGTEPAESMFTVNEYIAEDYWFAVNGSSLPKIFRSAQPCG